MNSGQRRGGLFYWRLGTGGIINMKVGVIGDKGTPDINWDWVQLSMIGRYRGL
jgi:hypothetical protein